MCGRVSTSKLCMDKLCCMHVCMHMYAYVCICMYVCMYVCITNDNDPFRGKVPRGPEHVTLKSMVSENYHSKFGGSQC